MRFLAAFAVLPALLLAPACSEITPTSQEAPGVSPILTSEDAQDWLTFAKPEVARVTHVALDLNLDFEAKEVSGTATLDIEAANDAETIILDNDGYVVSAITAEDGSDLPFALGEAEEGKGAPLTVEIGAARKFTVTYSAKEPDALQWLSPEQTAGGKQPFVFSQGQDILNRSWIPTQDSPGIRQTWEARITAPADLTVVMSGLTAGEPEEAEGAAGEGRRAFNFSMDKPVAPYLIAIAAGDIVFRELGPRSGVWSEPSMIDAAAAELDDTEAMIDAAEALYGPYRWGRYDMIVLPPAFPYGGMENPVMTFLTPTFIAGDKSLTGLIAHELAHSWSGNLVTNANWSDSWLNEGVTSYFENRIVEAIYGEKRAQQEVALDFSAIETALADVGADAPGTALHQPQGTDSAGSAIIYNKGAAFLRTVESAVGRERFDAYLTSWFDRHAFQPATSAMFIADMRENLIAGDEALEDSLRLDEWIYGTGLPGNVVQPAASAFAEVDAAAQGFAENRDLDAAAWGGWTSAERQRYLQKLPRELDEADLAALDSALKLSGSGNNEELFLWLELALSNQSEAVVPLTERFLARVGRRKFVAPLFETLMEQGAWGQAIARRIYAKTRPGYHSVTTGTVDELVQG